MRKRGSEKSPKTNTTGKQEREKKEKGLRGRNESQRNIYVSEESKAQALSPLLSFLYFSLARCLLWTTQIDQTMQKGRFPHQASRTRSNPIYISTVHGPGLPPQVQQTHNSSSNGCRMVGKEDCEGWTGGIRLGAREGGKGRGGGGGGGEDQAAVTARLLL